MRRRKDKPHTDDLYGPRERRKDRTMEVTMIVFVLVVVVLVVMVMRF